MGICLAPKQTWVDNLDTVFNSVCQWNNTIDTKDSWINVLARDPSSAQRKALPLHFIP